MATQGRHRTEIVRCLSDAELVTVVLLTLAVLQVLQGDSETNKIPADLHLYRGRGGT